MICQICGKEFEKRIKSKLFCSLSCGARFHHIQKRIFAVYSFDRKGAKRELARLEKLGKDFRFPKKFDTENIFYAVEYH